MIRRRSRTRRESASSRPGSFGSEPASWTGWAADPGHAWAAATFSLTDDSLVIVRDMPLRDVTTVLSLDDVFDVSVVDVRGADPVLEVLTLDGSRARVGWAQEHTPMLIAALQRSDGQPA